MLIQNDDILSVLSGSNYFCATRACEWDVFTNPNDWGYYSKENGDCRFCKAKCSQDNNCGAVECGGSYCSWWKLGKCTMKHAYIETDNLTCYKRGELLES